MKQRSLKLITASSWVTLLVCVLMFFYFAVSIPNIISEKIIEDEGKDVQQIRSLTDLHELQNIAAIRTEEDANVMDSSRIFLIISVGMFLFCAICAGINLRQLHNLKRYIQETADSSKSAPKPN